MVDSNEKSLTNLLQGPVLVIPLENKEEKHVDEMYVGHVREVEISKQCDITKYTGYEFPSEEESQEEKNSWR